MKRSVFLLHAKDGPPGQRQPGGCVHSWTTLESLSKSSMDYSCRHTATRVTATVVNFAAESHLLGWTAAGRKRIAMAHLLEPVAWQLACQLQACNAYKKLWHIRDIVPIAAIGYATRRTLFSSLDVVLGEEPVSIDLLVFTPSNQ